MINLGSPKNKFSQRTIIGWREWVSLPELGIDQIKAKIDTGARTSTLHALNIITTKDNHGKTSVNFQVYPKQRNVKYVLNCKANLLEQRAVKNSGGNIEHRYIIETILHMAGNTLSIELTLTNRENMGFRLLLGRTALSKKFLIVPNKSFLL